MQLGNPTKFRFVVDGNVVASAVVDSCTPWPKIGDSFDAGGRVLRIVDRRIISTLDIVVFRCVDEAAVRANEWPSGEIAD